MKRRTRTDLLIGGFCAVVFGAIVLCTYKAHAQRVDSMTSEQRLQQNELDLRFMQKEIAKMRYSEVCATIHAPPKDFVDMVKHAADDGNEQAQRAFMWIYRILETYTKAGCGDA